MNEEILKLVKEYGDWNGETVEMNDVGIESFYKAAFNAGLSAAIEAAEKVNGGYKLVPIEPTEEMIASTDGAYRSPVNVYRTMLNAAPKGKTL